MAKSAYTSELFKKRGVEIIKSFSNILSFPLFFACSFIKEDTSDKMDGKTFIILFHVSTVDSFTVF